MCETVVESVGARQGRVAECVKGEAAKVEKSLNERWAGRPLNERSIQRYMG